MEKHIRQNPKPNDADDFFEDALAESRGWTIYREDKGFMLLKMYVRRLKGEDNIQVIAKQRWTSIEDGSETFRWETFEYGKECKDPIRFEGEVKATQEFDGEQLHRSDTVICDTLEEALDREWS